jgi:hypothetical protein
MKGRGKKEKREVWKKIKGEREKKGRRKKKIKKFIKKRENEKQ